MHGFSTKSFSNLNHWLGWVEVIYVNFSFIYLPLGTIICHILAQVSPEFEFKVTHKAFTANLGNLLVDITHVMQGISSASKKCTRGDYYCKIYQAIKVHKSFAKS